MLTAIPTGCSGKSNVSSADTCGIPDKPVHTPAHVESWDRLAGGETFQPRTDGWYFTTTYDLVCKDDELEPWGGGTYLRFFTDGTVRQNDLVPPTYPQESEIVMDELSREGFDNAGFEGATWGCCSRGRGTFDDESFTISEFKPAQSIPTQEWQVIEIGDTTFSAVLPYTSGTGGERYTFEFHPND